MEQFFRNVETFAVSTFPFIALSCFVLGVVCFAVGNRMRWLYLFFLSIPGFVLQFCMIAAGLLGAVYTGYNATQDLSFIWKTGFDLGMTLWRATFLGYGLNWIPFFFFIAHISSFNGASLAYCTRHFIFAASYLGTTLWLSANSAMS